MTGRKRCICGHYLTPLDNGTMPRHTRLITVDTSTNPHPYNRVHCYGSGKFPPATVGARLKAAARNDEQVNTNSPVYFIYTSPRVTPTVGSRRGRRVGTKLRYKRNRAGAYTR